MTILILYGTTEGQTRKIVGFMVDHLESAGHAVTVVEAIDAPGDLDLRRFGAVIVAASLHLGRYQTAVEDFVHNHAATLNGVRTAFVSGVARGRRRR